jgi:hypothetical protein
MLRSPFETLIPMSLLTGRLVGAPVADEEKRVRVMEYAVGNDG